MSFNELKKYRVCVIYFYDENDTDTEYIKDFFFKFNAKRYIKKHRNDLVSADDKNNYYRICLCIEREYGRKDDFFTNSKVEIVDTIGGNYGI